MGVDYLAALRRDGDRIVAVSEAGLDRPVPSCARWTIADLIWHVGVVHTFWRQVAVGAITGPETYQEPARPPNLVDWFRDGVAETSDTFAGIDPAVPAWGLGDVDKTWDLSGAELRTKPRCTVGTP